MYLRVTSIHHPSYIMLNLGFVSAILPDYDLNSVLKFASEQRFSCVELMCWPSDITDTRRYAGVTHIDVDNLDMAHIHALTHEYGVSISGLGYYPNPLDPNPEQAEFYREHIKKTIRAAAKLGVSVVNTFIGRNPSLSIADNLKLYGEHWPGIVKLAEECNVKIGIENCPMWFTDDEWPGGKNIATTPAIWDRMFEIIPSPNCIPTSSTAWALWRIRWNTTPPNYRAWATFAGARFSQL